MIEYRPILGFPDYLINSKGDVISTRKGAPRIKKSCYDRAGYRAIRITNPDGITFSFLVHRLVLETFVGPCPNGLQTRHLNGIRDDNRVENLVWGTYAENTEDKRRHGTIKFPPKRNGSECSHAKLNEAVVAQILVSEEKGGVLAKRFGVCESLMTQIRKRQIWKHVNV